MGAAGFGGPFAPSAQFTKMGKFTKYSRISRTFGWAKTLSNCLAPLCGDALKKPPHNSIIECAAVFNAK